MGASASAIAGDFRRLGGAITPPHRFGVTFQPSSFSLGWIRTLGPTSEPADTSAGAFIPTHGFATIVISTIVLGFFLFVALVFAMALRSERREKGAA